MMVITSESLEYILLGPASSWQVILRDGWQITALYIERVVQMQPVTTSHLFFHWLSE